MCLHFACSGMALGQVMTTSPTAWWLQRKLHLTKSCQLRPELRLAQLMLAWKWQYVSGSNRACLVSIRQHSTLMKHLSSHHLACLSAALWRAALLHPGDVLGALQSLLRQAAPVCP